LSEEIEKEEGTPSYAAIGNYCLNRKEKYHIIVLSDSEEILLRKIKNEDGLEESYYSRDLNPLHADIRKGIKQYGTAYAHPEREVKKYIIREGEVLFDREEFCYDPWVINFENGYYDIEEDKFFKPSDKKIFFYCIPHSFSEDFYEKLKGWDEKKQGKKICPRFKKALSEWGFPEKKDEKEQFITQEDMFEFMGYCMTPNTSLKKAFLNFGETDSGKTSFLDILEFLVGEKNCSYIELRRMMKDQFGTDGLEFRILNSFDDLPRKKLQDIGIFKTIVGGKKKVGAEIKGGRKYKFRNVVKLWFNTNSPPEIERKDDDAFWNRWILIHFSNQFLIGDKKRIEDFFSFYKRIFESPTEKQGIFYELIKSLKRLKERGYFRLAISSIEHVKREWLFNNDPLFRFIDSVCDYGGKINTEKFYGIYNGFRKVENLPEVSQNTITREMKNMGFVYKRTTEKNGSNISYYFGLKFNKELQDKLS